MHNLDFEEKVNNQRFIGAGIECGYNVTDNLFIMLGLDCQEFKTAKGSTQVTDTMTAETFQYDGDAAGIAHHSSAANISIGYIF